MSTMANTAKPRPPRRRFTEVFKAGAVRLVLEKGQTVGRVARELDLTESAHAQRDRQLRVLIRASHEASRRAYGSPRIHRDQGHRVSRKRVIRLKQVEGLTARVGKRFKCTTMSDPDQPVAANVLVQDFVADAPNQRWVGDTTEFVIGSSGKLYLAAVLDLYSRFLVGWAVSAINDRHLVIKALQMPLKRREPAAGLLHHSDQGSPYASEDYQRIIKTHRMTGSMSRRGNCYDNALMESWFSTVKHKLGEHFDSCGDAKMALFDLGHYDVTALIGEGAMRQVYRATDTKLNRDVDSSAAKTLDPGILGQASTSASLGWQVKVCPRSYESVRA